MSPYFLVVKFDSQVNLQMIREIAEEFVEWPFVESVSIHAAPDKKQQSLFGEQSFKE